MEVLMRFITSMAETEQSEDNGKWYTEHNQLFEDEDGKIYLVPRNYKTDGYTIPNWIAWLGGGKMQWDIRPAIGHDFECQYHSEILVKLSFPELVEMGFLKPKEKGGKSILICKNIPVEFLEVRKTTFNRVNSKFKRMMMATKNLKQWRINLMRGAVNLNPGWIATRNNNFDISKIYTRIL
jgi:hypothetical protein